MINIEDMLVESPIIAAVRTDEDLVSAIRSSIPIVFVLYGSILNIHSLCKKLKDAGKVVFIHLDLLEGLKSDISGIEFIKKYANPHGIITTKTTNIKYAKQQGLLTIQRIFIIDSLSLTTGIKGINDVKPDAVEVMPGIASKIINTMKDKIKPPIIAGGLITTKDDVMEALSSGAVAISTACKSLWKEQ